MQSRSSVIPSTRIEQFLDEHRLPRAFLDTVEAHYAPLARWLHDVRPRGRPMLLGINGAQGTGKSTLAEFLAMAADSLYDWRTAVLSIDDFYLTRAKRRALAADVHPLLSTRGVPGTHDTGLLSATLDALVHLAAKHTFELPRFDKAEDDRAATADWPAVTGPVDVIILEGWCVGSSAQPDAALSEPVNELERDEDAAGTWRRFVNEKLARDYTPIFERLDALVFLAAPSFDAILAWRIEQEHKLAKRLQGSGSAIMSDEEVARFIRFYERITRHNLATLRGRADVVLDLAEDHSVAESAYSA